MTVSIAQFRADFPEFSDATVYPDSAFTFWYAIACKLIDVALWAGLFNIGAELYVAHNLVIEARAAAAAAAGAIPGETVGSLNSKSVDKVSMGYDTSSSVEKDAGHWNLTVYGTRYIRLARMVGVGAVQVGGVGPGGDSLLAWNGPVTTPGFSNFS